jgi:hypothetical protein
MTRPYKHHQRTVRANDIISSCRYDDSNKDEFWVGYKLKRKPFLKIYKDSTRNTLNIRILIEYLCDDIIVNHQPIIITQYITNIDTFRIVLSRVLSTPKYIKHKISLRKIDSEIILALTDQDKFDLSSLRLDYYYTNSITLTTAHLSTPGLLLSLLRIIVIIPTRMTFTGPKPDLEQSLNNLMGFTNQSQSIRIISHADNLSHDIRILDQTILTDILSKID